MCLGERGAVAGRRHNLPPVEEPLRNGVGRDHPDAEVCARVDDLHRKLPAARAEALPGRGFFFGPGGSEPAAHPLRVAAGGGGHF